MTFGTVNFMDQIYEVKGEILNFYLSRGRLQEAMNKIIAWVSRRDIHQLADSSQIQIIDGDIISCRLHDNLDSLIEILDFDIEFIDFELDPQLMIVHIRIQIQ